MPISFKEKLSKLPAVINPWYVFSVLTVIMWLLISAYLSGGIDGALHVASIIGTITIMAVLPFSLLVRIAVYFAIALTFEAEAPGQTNTIIFVGILACEFISLFIRNWRSFTSMLQPSPPVSYSGDDLQLPMNIPTSISDRSINISQLSSFDIAGRDFTKM